MLIVRSCINEALKLYHMHKLRVIAAHWVLAVILKTKRLAIVTHFDPEAVFI